MPVASDYRYGLYLRPDYAMCRAQSDLHRLLAAQYNLHAAGRFMPHATIKGFFRSDATVEAMVAHLDQALADWQPFTVYNGGVLRFGPRTLVISLKNLPDGTPNPDLYELQERVWTALDPDIHAECEFSPRDPRGQDGARAFHAHLSLVMGELVRPGLQDEVFDFIMEGAPVGPPQFQANTLQLFRFSADWQDRWWRDLTWEHLHSWRR